ncbi:MAG: glycosyltransferase [Methylococcaceae bacterium]|nr:glycosyltransferase [Methylococcaceae bacterium]
MTKRVLMIGFHFPPLKGSSGVQRTLKFCQYLPLFGWKPIVLSASPRAYQSVSSEQMSDIVGELIVERAFALDAARHLSIAGRYPKLLAIPDRWASWFFSGMVSGLRLIRKFQPQIIWSTYPIATAHLIGYGLHRLTGLPWVVDLRDPMAQEGYPEDPLIWKSFKWIEDRIARDAAAICFTSFGAIDYFREQHAGIAASKLVLLENGYDEENFVTAEKLIHPLPQKNPHPLTLVHSGTIYPSERDPRPFFTALSQLKQAGSLDSSSLKIIFRATGHDGYLLPLIEASNIQDIIELAPPIPYTEALAEMLTVDALLILQAPNCNAQIPAKLYEYIRAGKPILALTDENGDSAKVLTRFPHNMIADITSSHDIACKLLEFLKQLDQETPNTASQESICTYSRENRTRELASVFDAIMKR